MNRTQPVIGRWTKAFVIALTGAIASVVFTVREMHQQASWLVTSDQSGYPTFFTNQLLALLNGTFAVPARTLGDECYLINGECVGYFGLSPSLLRLPLVVALGQYDFTPLLTGLAYVFLTMLSVWLVIDFANLPMWQGSNFRLLSQRVLLVGALISAGPGSLALLATRFDVANEAILWAAVFSTAFALILLRLLFGSGQHAWLLVVLGLLSASSRPVGAAYIVGLSAAALICLKFIPAQRTRLRLSLWLALFSAPASVLLTFRAKFGSWLPDTGTYVFAQKSPLWQGLLDQHGGSLTGLIFMPTQLWALVRPDAVHIEWMFPRGAFYTPVYQVWPLDAGGSLVEPSPSLTTLAPTAIGLTVLALTVPWFLRNSIWRSLRFGSALVLGASVGLGPLLLTGAFSARYLVDAVPLLVLGTAVGVTAIAALRLGRLLRWLVALVILASAVGGWGLLLVVMR